MNFERVILIAILIIFITAFPFFSIPYFETDLISKFYFKYILIPFTLLVLYFISKKRKSFFVNITNYLKKILLVITFLTIVNIFFLLFFVSLTTIINCYIGKSTNIEIKSIVLDAKYSIGKTGLKRYYITFNDKKLGYIKDLEVYRKYEKNELFVKKMKSGSLGLLYSKN